MSTIEVPPNRVPGKAFFWLADGLLLIVFFKNYQERERQSPGLSPFLMRTLMSSWEPFPPPMTSANPNYFLKTPLQMTLCWELGTQHIQFKGT